MSYAGTKQLCSCVSSAMKNKFGAGSTEGAERERNRVMVQSEGRKSTLVWIPPALLFFTFDFFQSSVFEPRAQGSLS